MARQARGEYLDPKEVQVVHGIQRCVRQCFLCGEDRSTGKSFEHRRGWIRDRMEFLASVFGIDCLTYTVLSNHLHVVLRNRPDVVQTWSDEEVARRWLTLFPERRNEQEEPEEPTKEELRMITSDAQRLEELRTRLSDISWWMRCLAENIAVRSNKEEQISGRFWQGRYKAVLLLDEMSLLACAAYVDLNPIRAALAELPELSDYTGAKDRIDDLRERSKKRGLSAMLDRATHDWERSGRRKHSGWMSPLEINEKSDPVGPNPSSCGRRASLKGFLSMSLARYLELLDWTGRQIRSGKRGAIPAHLAPMLERLRLDGDSWCDLVAQFGKLFKRAAGTADSLAKEAARRGQHYMHAPGLKLMPACEA